MLKNFFILIYSLLNPKFSYVPIRKDSDVNLNHPYI